MKLEDLKQIDNQVAVTFRRNLDQDYKQELLEQLESLFEQGLFESLYLKLKEAILCGKIDKLHNTIRRLMVIVYRIEDTTQYELLSDFMFYLCQSCELPNKKACINDVLETPDLVALNNLSHLDINIGIYKLLNYLLGSVDTFLSIEDITDAVDIPLERLRIYMTHLRTALRVNNVTHLEIRTLNTYGYGIFKTSADQTTSEEQ